MPSSASGTGSRPRCRCRVHEYLQWGSGDILDSLWMFLMHQLGIVCLLSPALTVVVSAVGGLP